MEEQQKRQVAYKVRISDLTNGKYITQEGWNPNYVMVNGKKISRVNIIGVVVSKSGDAEYHSMVIDDGTKISVRSFEQNSFFKKADIGQIVNIIGRPKKYGEEVYILPEIVKETTKEWMEFRKLELEKTVKVPEIKKEEKIEVKEEIFDADMLIDFIKNNDKGEGVDFKDMLQIENAEKLVSTLLQEGDIFEIRPGVYKVLD